jgi:hypothetical protein
MPFPVRGWPPAPSTGTKSIRVRIAGSGTASFADNAYLFVDVVGANPFTPLPVVQPGSSTPVNLGLPPNGTGDNGSAGSDGPYPAIWCSNLAIEAAGGNLEFSFDGTNIHGIVLAGERRVYNFRYESGIAVRGASATFVVEAW